MHLACYREELKLLLSGIRHTFAVNFMVLADEQNKRNPENEA